MSRRRNPTLAALVRIDGILDLELGPKSSRRRHFLAPFTPPACFISALALSLIVGNSGAAQAACSSTVAGVDLTCTGSVSNPNAFNASGEFAVNIGTSSPSDPATITRTNNNSGLTINAGDHGGTINMTAASSITTTSGAGSNAHGLVISSATSTASRTYTIDLEGHIVPDAPSGDALRLEGNNNSIFNTTIGANAQLGGGAGDDSVIVTGAKSLLLKNYGLLEGGSGQPTTGGEGINVGNGTRIAASGVTINNYKTITGTGNPGIAGGQGISVFGAGDVTITNSRAGNITGASQGVRVDAAGIVSITNDGHIQGNSESGVEIVAATTATVTNDSQNTIEGATNGLYVHDVDAANINNDSGHIVGHAGAGVLVDNVENNVSVKNRLGIFGNAAKIEGSDDGLRISQVGGDISVDNTLSGKIIGQDGDGVHVEGADGKTSIDNSLLGSISGHDDGVHISDAGGQVTVNNSLGGKITGSNDDGIDISDARDAVTIDNSVAGNISGHDNGVQVRDVGKGVAIDNGLAGKITGQNGNGVDVSRVHDNVTIDNTVGGSISGNDSGARIANVRGDVAISNDAGQIAGSNDNGIDISDIRGNVGIQSVAGTITGHDDGVNVSDAGGQVTVNNSLGGKITGSNDDGIDISDARDAVTIDNSVAGNISGHDNGVQVRDVGKVVAIDNSLGGSITGSNGDGINVSDVRDDVTVNNRFGGSISGQNAGAKIADVRGDVTISNDAGQITGSHDSGIDASSVRGDVQVSNNLGKITGGDDGARIDDVRGDVGIQNWAGTISGSDDGVHVRDVHDDVTINNNFGSITGQHDDGIDLRDIDDDVAVDNAGGRVTGGDNGIKVSDLGDDLKITNSFGGRITGYSGDGINADDVDGRVTIDNRFGSNISGHDDGVRVSDADDRVTVNNSFGGSITGRRDDGIDISDVRDDASVDNRFGGTISGHDNGVQVKNIRDDVAIMNGFGGQITGRDGNGVDVNSVRDDVTIDNRFGGGISGRDDGAKIANVRGDVTIANSFGGKIRGQRADGINVSDVRGNVDVYNQVGGSIKGHDDGVKISRVDGDVGIDNDYATIEGRRGTGVDVKADGAVTVENDAGTIKGRTNAVSIDAGSVEINSSGLIEGAGRFAPTIKLSTDSGATINNNEGGVIRGSRELPSDLIVKAQGGAVTINNDGTMIGRIDLSGAGNTGAPNTFNNTSNNSWHVTGTSELGGGLADAYNNTGTVYTTDPNAPASNDVTVLAGVERFNNGGPAGAGTIDMQDGFAGDVFTLRPTTGGTLVFNGANGQSALKVDSFLGAASNSSSDKLVIDGSVTGSTAVYVNNLNHSFGSFNPTGIPVVSVSGSLPANSFYLAGGPINTGMFAYDLYQVGDPELVLASAPTQTFFELPSLLSAAQSNWRNATGAWLDRTADLRVAIEDPCVAGSLKDPATSCIRPTSGVWAKVLGSSESRSTDHSFAVLNVSQKHTVDTQLDGGGVVGGYDIIHTADDGIGIWMTGVMGGYLRSNLGFEHSPTSADFESGAVGGYLTYLRGGWFLDGQVMANLGNVKYSGSMGVRDHANVTSIGGVIDTGYRMAYGAGFIEPGATLSYVNAGIDDLGLYGTTVSFSNGDSLRGRVGARLGTTIVREQAKFEPFLGVSALYEFLGDNHAEVESGGYILKATDNLTGALGEVTGGINLFSLTNTGFNAFAKGDVQFGKDEFVGYGGSLGVRFDW